MNIDTTVGKALLKRLVGDEARFASEPQFCIRRCDDQAAWLVVPDRKAVNATYVDGVRVAETGVKVTAGSEITIGPDKARLKVKVQF